MALIGGPSPLSGWPDRDAKHSDCRVWWHLFLVVDQVVIVVVFSCGCHGGARAAGHLPELPKWSDQ